MAGCASRALQEEKKITVYLQAERTLYRNYEEIISVKSHAMFFRIKTQLIRRALTVPLPYPL